MPQGNRLGEKIARLRRARNMTQAELAEKLHFTYQAVSNWERGVSEPNAETLVALAAFFDTTADELLKGENPASADEGEGEAEQCAEEKVKISAPQALRIALWIYAGLSAVAAILSLSFSALWQLLSSAFGLLASVALIAVIVLFFYGKQSSGRRAVRFCFFACEGFAAVLYIPFAAAEGAGALACGILAVCFSAAALVLLALCFKAENRAKLKGYFILIAVGFPAAFATGIFSVLYLPIGIVAGIAALIAGAAAMLLLQGALRDRTVRSYFYTEQPTLFADGDAALREERKLAPEELERTQRERAALAAENAAFASEAAARRPAEGAEGREKTACAPEAKGVFSVCAELRESCGGAPVLPAGAQTAVHIALFVLPWFMLACTPGTGTPTLFAALTLPAALAGVLFAFGKEAKHPALAAAFGALWAANALYSFYPMAFAVLYPAGAAPNPSAVCPIFAVWLAAYAAALFAFRPRGRAGGKGIALRCVLLGLALAASAAGTALVLYYGAGDMQGVFFIVMSVCQLLLFAAHFITEDRKRRQ